ncbi:MAG: response regulator [Candidatus Omnitrophica bacterium]|nr:response regulator [Candidatus Omnitrophota bacterium]
MPKKLLIVDDETEIAEALKMFFTGKGYDAVTANRGKEAIDIVKRDEDIDLIIMDVKMPEMKGVEAFAKMREAGIEKPVLFLTGSINKSEYIQEVEKFGLDESVFLGKPIDLNLILEKVEEKLGGKK